MGKYRFKFSDMIPNAWFYKLKDMSSISSKTRTTAQLYNRKQQQQQQKPPPPPHISLPRDSYYFNSNNKFYNSPVNHKASDTHFPTDPSRKSSRKRKTVYKPSPRHRQSPEYHYCYVSSNESCSLDLDFTDSSDSEQDEKFIAAAAADYDDSWNCEVSSSTTDIIIDLNSNDSCKKHRLDGFDCDEISEMDLPPILTKPEAKFQKEKKKRSMKNCTGIRLRTNSPRIATKKIQGRKSISSSKSTSKSNSMISESFLIVKSSIDPQKDFRDSMVEMIVENNLQTAKDLEHLLACYLSLNSNEYHHIIVKAFEQVWFHMTTNLPM